MKDATNYILSEFYRLLNGSLSYDTIPVKVFALTQESSDTDRLFVRLYTAYVTDDNTKTNFGSKIYITLDIVSRLTEAERTEKKVNEVSSQIGELIMPSPSTTGLMSNTEFAIVNVKNGSPSVSFQDRSNTDYIVRKIITFEVTVNQL